MEQTRIERINELSRLSRERELTEAEQTERQTLRAEYIASMRASFTATMESTYLVDEQGNKTKLRGKLDNPSDKED